MHNYGPGQTHSFYELTRVSGPQELAETALTRASTTCITLTRLCSGHEVRGAACLEPTSTGPKTEFMKGHYYLNSVLTGNVPAERDARLPLRAGHPGVHALPGVRASAARGRGAAASSPEDLGLRPWLGDWESGAATERRAAVPPLRVYECLCRPRAGR
jgi:hypothetical protein